MSWNEQFPITPQEAQEESEAAHLFAEVTDEYRSPLWMITQQPILNDLVKYLVDFRTKLESDPQVDHELIFCRKNLSDIRSTFAEMIRQGEEKLHKLCELLCENYLRSVQLQSVVFGEVLTTKERFTLTQAITSEDLYSTIDLDLGSRQLRKLKIFDGKSWCTPELVANVVEYQPVEPNPHTIHKFVSRIKAEEEIWNKVVDEIFNLDSIIRRDKKFRHLSRFVKDVFGIKIVVGTTPDVQRMHQSLKELQFSSELLSKYHVPFDSQTATLSFVEIKDYLGDLERKKSGWEAIKSVVSWWDKVFEIQIQPLGKFMREREFLTRESHEGFKTARERIRDQVANQIPLFSFYRDLLKWLFVREQDQAPTFPGVRVVVTD